MFKFIEKLKENSFKRKCSRIERQATELYQIQEFKNELWLTFGGALICPCEMLAGDDSVKALKDIRTYYYERNVENL